MCVCDYALYTSRFIDYWLWFGKTENKWGFVKQSHTYRMEYYTVYKKTLRYNVALSLILVLSLLAKVK